MVEDEHRVFWPTEVKLDTMEECTTECTEDDYCTGWNFIETGTYCYHMKANIYEVMLFYLF